MENLQKVFKKHNHSKLFNELNSSGRILNPHRMKVDENYPIGNGNFGIVYRAIYQISDNRLIDAALKVLTQNVDESFAAFKKEIDIMKEFDHPNVMRLYGITMYNEKPGIVLPYMNGKDLRNYIRQNELSIRHLLDFAIQIASGMAYISMLGRVHRDLALRNCMLKIDSPFVVKVADFGLTREYNYQSSSNLYYSAQTNNALPSAWMSPEALRTNKFTTKSDVYSFGVALWELMTRGKTPWEYMDRNTILEELERGRRLPRPEYCPDLIYLIMCKCWMSNPRDRPEFQALHNELVEDAKLLIIIEDKEFHWYKNSFFWSSNSNSFRIFPDYNDPKIRSVLVQKAREEIVSKHFHEGHLLSNLHR